MTITIAAATAGAPFTKTQTFSLLVTKSVGDFSIAVNAIPGSTVVNRNVTWSGSLTALNGYGGSVTLSCTTGAPATCAVTPATLVPTAGGATFSVTVGSATAGAFSFTLQATDGTLAHATPIESLTVGTDVSWTNSGGATATVLAGQSASYSFMASPVGGTAFTSAVSFGCSNLPALTSCSFNPATISAGTSSSTPVNVTVLTTGPNLGTGSAPQKTNARAAGNVYLLMWLVALGTAGVGRKRRGNPRLLLFMLICLGLGLTSCGGVGGGTTTSHPITVTVVPQSGTVLFADEPGNSWPTTVTQQQFKATVNGSTDQTVTWAVMGGSANGTIDPGTGLYTAPPAVPTPATATVTATSSVAASPASAFVNLSTPTPLGTYQITVAATAAGGPAHGDVVTLTVQ